MLTALGLPITLLGLSMVDGSVMDHAKQTLITVIIMEIALMTFSKGQSAGKTKHLFLFNVEETYVIEYVCL